MRLHESEPVAWFQSGLARFLVIAKGFYAGFAEEPNQLNQPDTSEKPVNL